MTVTLDRPRTSARRRGPALLAACMGFFLVQLDATIVNVALPAIGRGVGGALSGLQWVVDAYTLTLAAALLTAGSRADRLGARRVFVAGLTGFALAAAPAWSGDSPSPRCWWAPPSCSACARWR